MMFRVRKKILSEDEDTLLLYDFAIGDYHTTHWYVAKTFGVRSVYQMGQMDHPITGTGKSWSSSASSFSRG